jgi:hypothetical protein
MMFAKVAEHNLVEDTLLLPYTGTVKAEPMLLGTDLTKREDRA